MGNKPQAEKPLRFSIGLLSFFICLAVVLLLVIRVRQGGKANDFPVFYYAAHMVLDGARTVLYDVNAQAAFQVRFGCDPRLFFYYPAFSLLPFFPIAVLPLHAAFAVWTALSLVLLTVSIKALSNQKESLSEYWPAVISLAFLPVIMNLLQGQLAIVILAAYIWCYVLWRRGRRFTGGLVLSLVMIKFQLVVGFISILFLLRKWRELAGFVSGAVPVVLLSAAVVGFSEFLHYPQFMLQHDGDQAVLPTSMANLRGLAVLILGNGNHFAVVAAVSVGVLLFCASLWKDFDSGFSAAIFASMLVSYHFNPYDLSLALIPICLLIRGLTSRVKILTAVGVVALPWFILRFGGVERFALLAIPMIATLAWQLLRQKRSVATANTATFSPNESVLSQAGSF